MGFCIVVEQEICISRYATGVRYVPGLKRNLILVGQLDDAGYAMLFKDSAWKITKGAMVIMKGLKCGILYKTMLRRIALLLLDQK